MTTKTREFLVLVCLVVAAAGSLLLFRDGIGIVLFLALGVATFVQLFRVALGSGKGRAKTVNNCE